MKSLALGDLYHAESTKRMMEERIPTWNAVLMDCDTWLGCILTGLLLGTTRKASEHVIAESCHRWETQRWQVFLI